MPSSAIHRTRLLALAPAPAPPENRKFTKPSRHCHVMRMKLLDPVCRYEPWRLMIAPSSA